MAHLERWGVFYQDLFCILNLYLERWGVFYLDIICIFCISFVFFVFYQDIICIFVFRKSLNFNLSASLRIINVGEEAWLVSWQIVEMVQNWWMSQFLWTQSSVKSLQDMIASHENKIFCSLFEAWKLSFNFLANFNQYSPLKRRTLFQNWLWVPIGCLFIFQGQYFQ